MQHFVLAPEPPLHGLCRSLSCVAARWDPSVSFSALKLCPLVSASPAILIRGLLFLLLAFIFLAEAGLRSHALFDVMTVHKDVLEIWPLHLCGAEGPSLDKKRNISQHLEWKLGIFVKRNSFRPLSTNTTEHLDLTFGVQASFFSLLL